MYSRYYVCVCVWFLLIVKFAVVCSQVVCVMVGVDRPEVLVGVQQFCGDETVNGSNLSLNLLFSSLDVFGPDIVCTWTV